ncbi:MAG: Rossmann fold domain-containing protein [Novosphingobium sp.]
MLVRVGVLPNDALDAASVFHTEVLPRLRTLADTAITCVFPQAGHGHADWRRAAIQSLARDIAPRRINAVASDDEAAIAAAEAYLSSAEGVTGQYLPLDGEGAGKVLQSPL